MSSYSNSLNLFRLVVGFSFSQTCNSNLVHERAAHRLLPFFMNRRADAAFNARIALLSKWHSRQKEGTISSYCKTLNYIPETYVEDDFIGVTDTKLMWFTQLSSKSSMEYAGALWNEALWCNRAYDEYELEKIYIIGLPKSIRPSMLHTGAQRRTHSTRLGATGDFDNDLHHCSRNKLTAAL